MKVAELANKAGVTAETVRHYTRQGLLQADRDPHNGYQLYNHSALKRLRFIQQSRLLGFSLKQIESIIEQAQQGDSPCPLVRDLLQKKVPETKAKIAQLQAHLQQMEQALETWKHMSDGVPDGNSICCLIEDWEDERMSSCNS
mgnify:FL=1